MGHVCRSAPPTARGRRHRRVGDAARNFADLLDAIEHRGEHFTIVRRGRAIAHLEPMSRGRGADVRELLRRNQPDPEWARDLDDVRGLLEIDDRS